MGIEIVTVVPPAATPEPREEHQAHAWLPLAHTGSEVDSRRAGSEVQIEDRDIGWRLGE